MVAVGGVLGVLYVGVTFFQVLLAVGTDDRVEADAIVVLGAAQYDGEPSPVLAGRLDHAEKLWREGVAPIVVTTGSNLPGDRFRGILDMDLTGSMYKLMTEKFNVVLARCKQTIGAINVDSEIAEILKLPENSAGIFIESLTFDENSIPIELLYSYHRGDKYKLEIELGRYHSSSNGFGFANND